MTLKGVEKLLFLRISRIEGTGSRIERGIKYRPVLAGWTCRMSTMAGNREPVPDQSFGGDRVLISMEYVRPRLWFQAKSRLFY